MKNVYFNYKINVANKATKKAYTISHYMREGLRVSYNFARSLYILDIITETDLEKMLKEVNNMLASIHLD